MSPRAEIAVDGRIFPVDILFADTFAMLADNDPRSPPALSSGLVDAIARGTAMDLRFDLVAEPPGSAPAFDGDVAIDLTAAGAGQAVAAVGHCNAPPSVAEMAVPPE